MSAGRGEYGGEAGAPRGVSARGTRHFGACASAHFGAERHRVGRAHPRNANRRGFRPKFEGAADAHTLDEPRQEIAGEGVAGRRRIHCFHLIRLLAKGRAVFDTERTFGAQRDDDLCLGEALAQDGSRLFGGAFAREVCRFYFVQDEDVDHFKGVFRYLSIERSRVHRYRHALAFCRGYDAPYRGYFILQEEDVTIAEASEGPGNEIAIHVLVGSAEEKYAIPARIVHLYDGMAIRLTRNANPARIDACRTQLLDEEAAFGTNLASVGDIDASPGEREALVEPLPSRENRQGTGGFRLARLEEIVDSVNIVYI